MKTDIIDYIESQFNIDVVSYNLLVELYECINNMWCGYEIVKYKGESYKVKAFLRDFIKRVNNCRIDLTMDELIENEIVGELVCKN